MDRKTVQPENNLEITPHGGKTALYPLWNQLMVMVPSLLVLLTTGILAWQLPFFTA